MLWTFASGLTPLTFKLASLTKKRKVGALLKKCIFAALLITLWLKFYEKGA